MKRIIQVSAVVCGLSTFLVAARAQIDSPTSNSGDPKAATSEEEKPDINEIVATATEFTNSVGMVMKKAGALWISPFETTQEAYQAVTSSNPSAFRGDQRPVDSVSWNDAIAFCKQLTSHEKKEGMLPEGYVYALPTQEQWESLAQGVSLEEAVTSKNGDRSGTAIVGSLKPSADGLYDLRGNVAEWAANPPDGAFRVLRGGSWQDWIDINLRLAFRTYEAPDVAKNTFGFRCVLIPGSY